MLVVGAGGVCQTRAGVFLQLCSCAECVAVSSSRQSGLFVSGRECGGRAGSALRRGGRTASQACQRRKRTNGEDLVVLLRRELSYRILCATAAIVRYAQFILS